MGNPRQRRKAKSSNSKVSYSKRHYKNKKKVVVKGPEVLVKNWDRSLTARQNYEKLGLMAVLDPRQSGGLEKKNGKSEGHTIEIDESLDNLEQALGMDVDSESEDEAPAPEPQQLQPGMGRIIRDANGKVIKIVLPGEDGDEHEEEVKEIERDGESEEEEEDSDEESAEESKESSETPWGAAFEDVTDFSQKRVDESQQTVKSAQGIAIVTDKISQVKAKTDVVRELETLSSRRTKTVTFSSDLELEWLLKLVAKHGDNVSAMVRDAKLNVWQRTKGQIKKSIEKAGGIELLKEQSKVPL